MNTDIQPLETARRKAERLYHTLRNRHDWSKEDEIHDLALQIKSFISFSERVNEYVKSFEKENPRDAAS